LVAGSGFLQKNNVGELVLPSPDPLKFILHPTLHKGTFFWDDNTVNMIVMILETVELAIKGKGNYNELFPPGTRVNAEDKVMTVTQVYYLPIHEEKILYNINNNGWEPETSDCWRLTTDEVMTSKKVHPFLHVFVPSSRIVYINKSIISSCTSWIVNILSDKKWITLTDIELIIYRYIENSPSHFNVDVYIKVALELEFTIMLPVSKSNFIKSLTNKISEYGT
jgi:hypothetical protein